MLYYIHYIHFAAIPETLGQTPFSACPGFSDSITHIWDLQLYVKSADPDDIIIIFYLFLFYYFL